MLNPCAFNVDQGVEKQLDKPDPLMVVQLIEIDNRRCVQLAVRTSA